MVPHGLDLPEDLPADVAWDRGVLQPAPLEVRPLVDQQVVLLVEGALAEAALERLRVGLLLGLLAGPVTNGPSVECVLQNMLMDASFVSLLPPGHSGEGLLHVQWLQGEHCQSIRGEEKEEEEVVVMGPPKASSPAVGRRNGLGSWGWSPTASRGEEEEEEYVYYVVWYSMCVCARWWRTGFVRPLVLLVCLVWPRRKVLRSESAECGG